jgi:hypothetical protein
MSEVKTNKLTAATGTAITLGDSGDTFTVPSGATLAVASGATIANSGTATGFGGDNTPYFSAYINSTYRITTDTTVVLHFDTEYTDSDSAFNTGTYQFTVPAGEGGTYWLGAYMTVEGWAGTLRDAQIKIEVNNVVKFTSMFDYQGNYINIASPSCSGNIVLAAADVVRVRSWTYTTSNVGELDVFGGGNCGFSGYKLIG